jgi:DNA-3-methyladenine glycosylase II
MRTNPVWAPHDLEEGIAFLCAREPVFAAIAARAGVPRFPLREPGFGTLLHIILEQQVSIEAAAAMYARLRSLCRPLDPRRFLELDEATLKSCGFSRQKTLYARGLAEALRDRRIDLQSLAALGDDDALATLTSLKGIGPWTAEVYLLFALGRTDIWPAADLGLQLGLQHALALEARPSTLETRRMAEPWRPWRSVAACLVWKDYLTRLGRRH